MSPSWPAPASARSHESGDTDVDSHRTQLEVLRRLGPQRRLDVALRMSDDARTVAMEGIAARHPDYSALQVRWVLFRKLLGDDLFRAAYPDAEELEP